MLEYFFGLNDVHLILSVVFRGNELLTKVPMDKHSNVNWMAAGLRLPRSSHGFFLLSLIFQT